MDIASRLRQRLHDQGLTQAELRDAAGVSQRTLTNVLSGEQDFKLSTLLAIVDRLGLEVVIVPKGAAAAIDTLSVAKPKVTSRVDAARRRLEDPL
jgi:transcriptional regulator with XRE-family HTH domain